MAEPIDVSVDILRRAFEDGRTAWEPLWRRVLSDGAAGAAGRGELDERAWVTLLYDYLAAFAAGAESERELLDSLIPLYFARTAAFVEQTAHGPHAQAELLVESLVEAAVELKPYLRERWNAASAGTLSPS